MSIWSKTVFARHDRVWVFSQMDSQQFWLRAQDAWMGKGFTKPHL